MVSVKPVKLQRIEEIGRAYRIKRRSKEKDLRVHETFVSRVRMGEKDHGGYGNAGAPQMEAAIMWQSMTGFGRAELEREGRKLTVELKSVNHRFSEVNVRFPRELSPLEERIKRLITSRLGRGRIDAFVTYSYQGEGLYQARVDKDLAVAYYNGMKDLAQAVGVPFTVGLTQLAGLPDVVKIERQADDLDKVWAMMEEALSVALDQLVIMRRHEGQRLAMDIEARLGTIGDLVRQVEDRAPLVVEDYQRRLRERIRELLGTVQVDEARLLTEVALFADRSAITEELVRLHSHQDQFACSLNSEETVGRKLDFLLQEMNREVNTIGSKANDLVIGGLVVELKAELEKIREQIQNIE